MSDQALAMIVGLFRREGWRSLMTLGLLCCAPQLRAADATVINNDWRYLDYQRYNGIQPRSAQDGLPLNTQPLSVGSLLQRQDGAFGPTRDVILSAGFDDRADWESIRYGLGAYTNLPDAGQLHFNLYVRPNAPRPGLRWQLQPSGLPLSSDDGRRLWSLGAFLDTGRGRAGLRTGIGLSPQLIVNLGSLLRLPGKAQMSVQYAYWRGEQSDDHTAGRAIQAALNWQF